jgi:hypothetical protein
VPKRRVRSRPFAHQLAEFDMWRRSERKWSGLGGGRPSKMQVRAYARLHLPLAKNDKLDAARIANCAAAIRRSIPRRILGWCHLPSI